MHLNKLIIMQNMQKKITPDIIKLIFISLRSVYCMGIINDANSLVINVQSIKIYIIWQYEVHKIYDLRGRIYTWAPTKMNCTTGSINTWPKPPRDHRNINRTFFLHSRGLGIHNGCNTSRPGVRNSGTFEESRVRVRETLRQHD